MSHARGECLWPVADPGNVGEVGQMWKSEPEKSGSNRGCRSILANSRFLLSGMRAPADLSVRAILLAVWHVPPIE